MVTQTSSLPYQFTLEDKVVGNESGGGIPWESNLSA
jgi:hypothetical protein